jgi:hypothetical protein
MTNDQPVEPRQIEHSRTSELPPRWEPGHPAKGFLLPDHSVITWQIDDDGNPTHDQSAKLIGMSLLDCEGLFVRWDARIEQAGISTWHTRADFEKAALLYDPRLWFADHDWDFS